MEMTSRQLQENRRMKAAVDAILLQQLKILSFESDSLKFPSQVSASVVHFYSHALLAMRGYQGCCSTN